MTAFVVKAPPQPEAERLTFHEKTMWRGRTIRAGDRVFLFAAEHFGGRGLFARGVAHEVSPGVGSRITLTVQVEAKPKRPLGRAELRAFRGGGDNAPGPELDHKLYEQATNKVAGISQEAEAFLDACF